MKHFPYRTRLNPGLGIITLGLTLLALSVAHVVLR
jgi:hypothetical protein